LGRASFIELLPLRQDVVVSHIAKSSHWPPGEGQPKLEICCE
jgi:hypothetical protein